MYDESLVALPICKYLNFQINTKINKIIYKQKTQQQNNQSIDLSIHDEVEYTLTSALD